MPWAASSNEQRLDRYNGLLLTASIDRLFDQGLISFTAEGDLMRKPDLSDVDLGYLGLQSSARLRFIDPRHQPYLSAHRKKFGF
jgi:hypothetical protein